MAEVNQQQGAAQQGAPQQGASQAGAGTGQQDQRSQSSQQQAAQEPKWLSHIPEAERAEARDGWMLKADHTRKTQEAAEQRKQFEAEQKAWKDKYGWMPDWYEKQYTPFYDKYGKVIAQNWGQFEQNWDKIQNVLTPQQQAALQQQMQHASDDQFANYDVLPPQEQAKRVAEYVGKQQQENLQGVLQQHSKVTQDAISNMGNQGMALFNTIMSVLDKLFIDAPVKPSQLINEAAQFKPDGTPIDWAYNKLTQGTREEKLVKDTEARVRREMEEERRNQAQSPGAIQNESIPHFRVKPKSEADIKSAVLEKWRQVQSGLSR